jgi:hypothetical protein
MPQRTLTHQTIKKLKLGFYNKFFHEINQLKGVPKVEHIIMYRGSKIQKIISIIQVCFSRRCKDCTNLWWNIGVGQTTDRMALIVNVNIDKDMAIELTTIP